MVHKWKILALVCEELGHHIVAFGLAVDLVEHQLQAYLSAALLEDRGKYTYSGLSNVKLSLPSFRTDYKIDMKSLLAGMGLPLGPYNELVENAAGTPPEISKVLH